ncbi:MAG: FG-GAP repeat protein, partial [Dehalococcoidia bacterium]
SLGFSVATGDLDGDGIDDILAGAPLADGCNNGSADAGDVYVISGRDTVPESIALDNAGDLTYFGGGAGDVAGFSVTAADFDGDGRKDLVIGALQADGPDDSRPDAGEVYVILR